MITPDEIRQNYLGIAEKMALAAQRCGRSPLDVHLVVVTKTHPVETLQAVLAAGLNDLGESYADEALLKVQTLAGNAEIVWHMIGHVQSRKAEIVARYFNYLHSLDSLKLAKRLDRFIGLAENAQMARRLPVLLECNTSGEENKFGYAAWDESAWPVLAAEFAEITALPNLDVRGLMTIAPYSDNAEDARPYFRKLAKLQGYLTQRLPEVKWAELSMGMSGDFGIAIEEGATWVRIGQRSVGLLPRIISDINGSA